MKTMSCRQLGGPCDLGHQGATADDVINAQDRHLKEAEKAGDETHQEARDAMKGRWRHPMKSMSWYRDMKAAFADLPSDDEGDHYEAKEGAAHGKHEEV